MIELYRGNTMAEQFRWNGRSCTLAQLLAGNGSGPDLPCGGRGRCGKCKVQASGDLLPIDAQEREKLTPSEIRKGFRLACKAVVCGENVRITLPDSGALQVETSTLPSDAAWSPWASGLGLSVDIGTTTVAAYLWDLDERRSLGVAARKNPQESFGADVVTRLEAALNGKGAALQACIRQCLTELAAQLCAEAGRSPLELGGAVIAGNTSMLYLLCGYEVQDLAFAPFPARHRFGAYMTAAELELPWSPDCRVYLPPCISAYVGADITCGLLACGVLSHPGSALLADVGTNGELVLLHGGRLLCCATAAGPAFEGVGISCGSGAVPGAIDRVELRDGRLSIHTIAEQPPVSLCGSGLLDAVSCLVQRGDIEDTGYMEADTIPLGGAAALTRSDIRAFQLAKSAVCAGIETLLAAAGISPETPDTVWLSGGFGSKLSPDSAARIGLLPAAFAGKVIPAGNTAAAGASQLLCHSGALAEIRQITALAETAELANSPVFQERFMEDMLLGEVR